jgi:hypothetical protein
MLTYIRPYGEEYETVAKSQTAQVLGTVGAIGDVIERLIIVPETVAAGAVALLDGATSISIKVLESAAALVPVTVELRMRSIEGPWKITTGDNVHVIAVGRFT